MSPEPAFEITINFGRIEPSRCTGEWAKRDGVWFPVMTPSRTYDGEGRLVREEPGLALCGIIGGPNPATYSDPPQRESLWQRLFGASP